jgi:hypothetical protein
MVVCFIILMGQCNKIVAEMGNKVADLHTVKGVRGKVSFDSQNDKYASKLSCDASPKAYLSLRVTVKRICHLVKYR